MENEILASIKEILNKDGQVNADSITMETKFEELDIDSLGSLLLINDLEDKYGIIIENDEVFKISTIGEAIVKVRKLIENK